MEVQSTSPEEPSIPSGATKVSAPDKPSMQMNLRLSLCDSVTRHARPHAVEWKVIAQTAIAVTGRSMFLRCHVSHVAESGIGLLARAAFCVDHGLY